MEAFGQLIELDEDDDLSFSETITLEYFEQALKTFKEMDENLSVHLNLDYCIIFLLTLCHEYELQRSQKHKATWRARSLPEGLIRTSRCQESQRRVQYDAILW